MTLTANFVAKFVKLADPTLIRHTGIPKRIAGWEFLFQKIKWQLIYSTVLIEILRDSAQYSPEFTTLECV